MTIDTRSLGVLTTELQRGVCGDLATIRPLAQAVRERGVEAAAARIVTWARQHHVLVVHCTFSLPADRSGLDMSLPLLRAARNDPAYMLDGSPPTELLPALGPDPVDLISNRHHGVSAFGGTDLDNTLRQRGIDTIALMGVSLNVGVIGTAIEAVNHGYQVVVVHDAIVGIPVEYGDSVLRNAVSAIATVVSSNELMT